MRITTRLTKSVLSAVVILSCARTPDDRSRDAARDAARGAVLGSFATALAAEGPVERIPLLIAEEMDSAEAALPAVHQLLAEEFPAYDREAWADLETRVRNPGRVEIPPSLASRIHLTDAATAGAMQDSIALTGQVILRLSPVGLDARQRRAAVMLSVECGSGCGARQAIFLSGNRDRWRVIQRVRIPSRDP